MIKKILTSLLSLLLTFVICLTSLTGSVSAADLATETGIASTDMSIVSPKSNLEDYYTGEDWNEEYPDGYFVVEYSSYEINEGGTDPKNPEDCYLGITVYRLGGYAQSSEVTYNVSLVSGNSSVYPDSQGTITFEPQQEAAVAKIKVYNNDVRDGDQLLLFSLEKCTTGDISVASTSVIKIYDDEPFVPSLIEMTTDKVVADMQDGHVKVTLKRSENIVDYCTLKIATVDGTAKAGVDFEAIDETVVFNAGETEKEICIPLIQSDNKFTDPKAFSVNIYDLMACNSDGATELRLNITNKLPEDKTLLTEVDAKADLTVDNSGTLADSSVTVVNVNDTVDRSKLLLSVVGAANGKVAANSSAKELVETKASGAAWGKHLTLSGSDFEMLYCSDGSESWNGSDFTNGNEDLMLASKDVLNLNHFTSTNFKFKNKEKAANGNPNTAFGYMRADGASDTNKKTGFVKTSLSNASEADLNKMKSMEKYFLYNANNKNVDALSSGETASLSDKNGKRWMYTVGKEASEMKMFVMLYDDEGWDDHNFTFGNLSLERAVIPFEVFNNSKKYTDFKVVEPSNGMPYIQYKYNNYTWTIAVSGTDGGVAKIGTGTSAENASYGFYIGSKLKITATTNVSGSAVPNPEYIYLTDSNGVVHNAAIRSSTSSVIAFEINLETLVNDDVNSLVNYYGMTKKEAEDHIACLNKGDVICEKFSGTLTIESKYSVNQSIEVDFSNIPSLITRKSGESEAQHEARVWSVLEDFLAFYDNDKSTPQDSKYLIDFSSNKISYSNNEFDYLIVSPQAVGGGYRVTSNLLNADYENFGDTQKISMDNLRQVSGTVTFTIFSDYTEYLIPNISTEYFGVAQKTESGFSSVYNSGSLSDYIPFEAMYPDTSDKPSVYYYKSIISISDIYAEGMSGEPKDYLVDVNYSSTSGTEQSRLFSFTFKGGSGFDVAKNVEMTNVSDKFSEANSFMPYVELLSSINGYRYAIYIPTYYNYQSDTAADYAKYSTIFKGADGISVEIHNYNKNTSELTDVSVADDGYSDIISTLNVNKTQYICTKLPDFDINSDSEEIESTYFEQQKDFYTYNDNYFRLDLSGISVDFSTVFAATGKLLVALSGDKNSAAVGNKMLYNPQLGPYIKLGNNSLTVGYKISYNGLKLYDSLNGTNKSTIYKAGAPAVANGAESGVKHKIKQTSSKVNADAGFFSVLGALDLKVQLLYDTHTHQYYFSSFSINGSITGAISMTVPIPATMNLVYGVFGVSATFVFGTGLRTVNSYVDQEGKTHTKVCWNGITLTPDFACSIGIGFGLSGFLAVEAGGSFDINASVIFGNETYYPPQRQYDLYTGFTSKDGVEAVFTGDTWTTISTMDPNEETYNDAKYDSQFYNNTVLQSIREGESLTISGKGTSFILKASKNTTGGCMSVTVTSNGDVLKTEYVDLLTNSASSDDYLPQIVFSWEAENYKSCDNYEFVVTIKHISRDEYNEMTGESTEGTGAYGEIDNITLDSFYIYNNNYSDASYYSIMSFSNFSAKIVFFLKFVILGVTINLEPAYMMTTWNGFKIEEDGFSCSDTWSITLGFVGYTNTFVFNGTELVSSEMAKKALKAKSTETADYFTLGEYAENKNKSVLQSDIKNSSKTKVVNYKGDVFAFYTALTIEADKTSNYRIYYSENGVYCGLVADTILVNDFDVFVTDDNKLAVVMTTSDSTVTSVIRDSDVEGVTMNVTDSSKAIKVSDTGSLSEMLKRTAVSIAFYNDSKGAFDSPKTISETDGNDRQEYLPIAVSSENGSSVVLYVKDEKTSLEADYNLNWSSFNDATNGTSETLKNLMDSLYSGESRIMYSVLKNGKIISTAEIPVDDVIKAKLKSGYKITSIDAVMQSSDTVAIAYSAEIPYSVLSGRTGTLKEIHYLTGKVDSTGKISFSKTVVIDSVFDYDESLSVVFSGVDLNDIPDAYYNESTDTFNDEIILNKVQLENAVIAENGYAIDGSAAKTPTLFYCTNSSINYVDYDNLNKAVSAADNSTSTDAKVGVLYDGSLDDYVIAVSDNGSVNLIFNNSTYAGNAYTDTLCVLEYNSLDRVWNKPRTLTKSDAFDQEAFDNRESTGAVSFENLSALITDDGDIAIALKSSYTPFNYDYGTTFDMLDSDDPDIYNYYDGIILDKNGESVPGIVAPMLDYSSEDAKTDICYITFDDPITAVDVSEFYLYNEVLTKGEHIDIEYSLDNVGDRTLEDIYVSMYITDKDRSFYTELISEELSGALLAGTGYQGALAFDITKNYPDGTILCMQITDAYGTTVYYDSFTESYLPHAQNPEDDTIMTYRIIEDVPELTVSGSKVRIDENGLMDFTVAVENLGTKDVSDSVTVKCSAYDINDAGEYYNKRTVFSFSLDKSNLKANDICYFTDSINVSEYIKDSSLYYNFEIVTSEPQYTVENDSSAITICKEDPKIGVDSVEISKKSNLNRSINYHSGTVSYVTLGQELNVTPLIVSSGYDINDIRIYEIGSRCLSIERNSNDNAMKLKVVALPENSEGIVRVVVSIKGTTIFKTFYLKVSDSEVLNFNESLVSTGFEFSAEDYVYAENFDLATTETNGSTLSFSFTGTKLRIYGNRLVNGGDFEIVATDSKGKEVIRQVVSTASKLNDYGMLLFMSDELGLDTYNVTIKANISGKEKLSLDAAKYTVDLSNVDTTPYYYVESYLDELDAPLLSGRSRAARFALNFNNGIKLCDGVKVQDITLDFDEYEDGVATGNKVTFTGAEIKDGKTLVLGAQLSSKAGAVLTYRLSDSDIPEGYLISDRGRAVNTAIPDYDTVSYELKESGIMSVTVAEDLNMPDGNVKKSVLVRFMTAPDVSRLEGTKLLYKTEGTDDTVEFKFVSLTDDSRTAVYRAGALTLESEELSKTFSFEKGIVLNESNYVLITADGDYLENDITTVISDKSQLDIVYNKLVSNQAPLLQAVSDYSSEALAYIPVMYLYFDEAVDVSSVINNKGAYVNALETVTDENTGEKSEKEIKLYLDTISLQDRVLCFKAESSSSYAENEIVSISLLSEEIQYSNENSFICRKLDKIAINPQLKSAKVLTFNTDAYIVSATPYLANGVLGRTGNTLCVDVSFSTVVDEKTLSGTSVAVTEYIEKYDETHTEKLTVEYRSVKTVTDEIGTHSVATYSCVDDVSLKYDEVKKIYSVLSGILTPENQPILTADGKHEFAKVILSSTLLKLTRAEAESADFELVSNDEKGYSLYLNVYFNDSIRKELDGSVYACVNMQVDDENTEVYMTLDKVEDSKLRFVSVTPVTIPAGKVAIFTTPDRFSDSESTITDVRGVGVSESIKELADFTVDATKRGAVSDTSLESRLVNSNETELIAKIQFTESVSDKAFANSTVDVIQKLTFSDLSKSNVKYTLVFDSITESNTAIYKAIISIPQNADSCTFVLGDSIDNANSLYSQDKFIILSTDLSHVGTTLTLNKSTVEKTEILNSNTSNTIDSIDDTYISVTYNDNIYVNNPSGITLKARVSGINGVTAVTYTAKEISDSKTLLLYTDEIDAKYANLVKISLDQANLSIDKDSSLYSESGLAVSVSIGNASAEFLCNGSQSVTIPDDNTEPATVTQTAAVPTEAPSDTVPATVSADTSVDINASSEAETTPNDEDKGFLTTGQKSCIALGFVLLLGSAMVIVLLRRKKNVNVR